MLTPRIFVGTQAPPSPGADYALGDAAARHVAQALRMRVGDRLALFTGEGGEFTAAIARIDRAGVVVRVERHDAVEREAPAPIVLVQAVIASDMMDFVVRKAVELGTAAIVPIQCSRSQGLPQARVARRVQHWQQIAFAACEQCGRNRVPEVADVAPFAQWLAGIDVDAHRIAMLQASAPNSLAQVAGAARLHAVAVGPEGGFAPEEAAAAADRGLSFAHLGARVLRAETAALAALATINAVAGDAA
jgi:16S rRNA (uracil1498-N3)-methyltransferase